MQRQQSPARIFLAAAIGALACACSDSNAVSTPLLTPAPAGETEPVSASDDAADDPAIWVHPRDPALSLVLGTNKQGGLDVYALDGARLATVSDGLQPDNVDVAYDITLGKERIDVAGAAARGQERGFMMWRIDAEQRSLAPLFEHPLSVFDGGEPYGSTLYRRARDGQLFFFVNDKRGHVEQYAVDGSSGVMQAVRVRAFEVGSQTEGCVADDEFGRFYVSEENRAIWSYGAEPTDPCTTGDRVAIERLDGEHGAVKDLEGLTIYYARDGGGYLIASIQGANRFFVYERAAAHALVAIIDPVANAKFGDVSDTDGIVVESFGLGERFPRGVFVAQDGDNAPHDQNFKLYAWPAVAGTRLVVDAARDPRKPLWRRTDQSSR